jgi:hypothetical protein
MTPTWPFVDRALARRLERTEARSNAAFVEARAQLEPERGATWVNVAGVHAMFDGVGSPLTQTFGLGLFNPVGDTELDRIESFFRERGSGVFHEVSPLAEDGLQARLVSRGYRPIEFSSVLFRPIGTDALPVPAHIHVRVTARDEADLWAAVAAEGWGETPELATFMRAIGAISARARGTTTFLAEVGGQPIAAAALSLGDGVALLAGASTVPGGRRQGAQLALLDARLRFAAERGSDLAMMAAGPGSSSQRNAERQGFRIAYTRIKWEA